MIVVNKLPDEPIVALRSLLLDGFERENPIRIEGYRQALSAALHRLAEFGVEDTFENYGAMDLLNMTLVGSGGMTDFFIRTAGMRAILEEDMQAIDFIEKAGLAPYVLGWYQDWSKVSEAEAVKSLPKSCRSWQSTTIMMRRGKSRAKTAKPHWLAALLSADVSLT